MSDGESGDEFEKSTAVAGQNERLVMCGYCKDCKHRSSTKRCENDSKLDEDYGQPDQSDMLVYDYQEGGGFTVGDYFGCVHFVQK